jgi:hypothetical protein
MSARARAGVCGVLGVVVALVLGAGALAPPALAGGGCANEGVRGEGALNPESQLSVSLQLPDCRAYELVSPAYKEGYPVVETLAISGDGSRVLGLSLGSFAGAENSFGFGAVYEFTREGSGWVETPLEASPARFGLQVYLGASADLTRTLWNMGGSLYVREADGSYVKVGPLPGVEEYGGGWSADLSHVVINHAGNLYEYAGTGESLPAPVGVNDEGQPIGCGVDQGSSNGQDTYNAVSASGETVFFTSKSSEICPGGTAVSEVYARVDQHETVAVSEPTVAQCEACLTASPQPATFQGASEDGSKVFFLTEQELLPGREGMNLYEYDFADPGAHKIVLVSGGASEHLSSNPEVQGVARVSEDGSHVYFGARGVLAGANREGRSPVAGEENLYVFERDAAHPQGRTAFIATLTSFDGGSDWRASDNRLVQATPDGRFLVFASIADLTPDDSSAFSRQIFEYDAQEERLVRVSIGQCPAAETTCAAGERFNNDGNTEGDEAEIPEVHYTGRSEPTKAESGLAVSSDGSYVFFQTPDGLTPRALNNKMINTYEERHRLAQNVYEYHSAGSIASGNVYLLSDGRDVSVNRSGEAAGVQLWGGDASGRDVFFSSGDPLVGQDTDTQLDIYDARLGGGFPAPVLPAGCEGEACAGSPSGSPLFGSLGSAAGVGGGNVSTVLGPAPVKAPVKPRALSRAQKLARALQACRHRASGRRRAVCKAQARKRYGNSKAKTSGGRTR